MEGHPVIESLRGLLLPGTTTADIVNLINELAAGDTATLDNFRRFIGRHFNRTNVFARATDEHNILYIGGEINLARVPDGRLIRRFDKFIIGDGEEAVADRLARQIMFNKGEKNKNNPTRGRRSNTARAPFELGASARDILYELFANQLISVTPETSQMVPRILEVHLQPQGPVSRNGTRDPEQIIFIYEPMPEILIRTLTIPVTAQQLFPNVMRMAENLQLLQTTHRFIHRNLNAAFVFENHMLIQLRDSVIQFDDRTFYGFGSVLRPPTDAFPFEDLYLFIATLYSHLLHIINLRLGDVQVYKLGDSGYRLLNRFFVGSAVDNITDRISEPQQHSRLGSRFKVKNIRQANNSAFFAAHPDYFNRFVPATFLTEFNEVNLNQFNLEEPVEVSNELPEAGLNEEVVSETNIHAGLVPAALVPMESGSAAAAPGYSPIVTAPVRRPRNAPPELPAYNSYNRREHRRSRSRSRERAENRLRETRGRNRGRNRWGNENNNRGRRTRRGHKK